MPSKLIEKNKTKDIFYGFNYDKMFKAIFVGFNEDRTCAENRCKAFERFGGYFGQTIDSCFRSVE